LIEQRLFYIPNEDHVLINPAAADSQLRTILRTVEVKDPIRGEVRQLFDRPFAIVSRQMFETPLFR
jgi:hypothetical protein